MFVLLYKARQAIYLTARRSAGTALATFRQLLCRAVARRLCGGENTFGRGFVYRVSMNYTVLFIGYLSRISNGSAAT